MEKRATDSGRDGMAPVPIWLAEFMENECLEFWGAADLSEFTTPSDSDGIGFPAAISWVVPMDAAIMAGIRTGPTEAYAAAYTEANERINDVASRLAAELRRRVARALPLAASVRTDEVALHGDFPHKTAATRAGLGWIGRHCQLVTFDYGPWVRLGTVFTDMELPCGPPSIRTSAESVLSVWKHVRPMHLPARNGIRVYRGRRFWMPDHAIYGRQSIIPRTTANTIAASVRLRVRSDTSR